MQNFRDLKVWNKAHSVVLAVYAATEQFPNAERYGLVSQMRRAAASIPSNIAEGTGRSSNADFARFLYIATASANELEYFVMLSRDLQFLNSPTHDSLVTRIVEIRRMLTSLIARLKPEDLY